ncbi:MAG: glycosyltransferase family 2 protein [Gammaproteobacteria bacterium]|nr:glycosyltransferase family 2 protein [Gammaproteobacteria bacterium]
MTGELISALRSQTFQAIQFLVIDSESTDGYIEAFRNAGATVHVIRRSEFNHGKTRQLAVDMFPNADVVVFLTQDAILTDPRALEKLADAFNNPRVGAVYGRQLPRPSAGPIEAHARLFNYPSSGLIKTAGDIPHLGIKTAFISNSFAAYRRTALMQVGGFPSRTILGEDTYVAAKMLLSNWHVAYCADATVFHSHDYGFVEEFKRYFDTGVFHGQEQWIRGRFGNASNEGMKFLISELRYLWQHRPVLVISALIRTAFKYAGFQLGLRERYLPLWIKRRMSMHRRFWNHTS